jgi:hypothetical protein
MTFRLSDDERKFAQATLKACLDDVQTEMARADSPEFNGQLKREEQIIHALSPSVSRRPAKIVRSGRRRPTEKRQR